MFPHLTVTSHPDLHSNPPNNHTFPDRLQVPPPPKKKFVNCRHARLLYLISLIQALHPSRSSSLSPCKVSYGVIAVEYPNRLEAKDRLRQGP